MYMHLLRLHKTLQQDGAFRYQRHGLLHFFPRGFPKLFAKSRFSEVPVRFGLCDLSLARCRKTKEALPFVCSLV